MTLELRPASSLPTDELAELFRRGYEDFVIPFHVDENAVRFMVEMFDIDLDASRIAVRDGTAIGLANLAIRGDRGWIGGVGVVKDARRHGVGERLMEAVHGEARERGLREIRLEVIEQNEAAYRLYLKLGYEVIREVEIATIDGELPGGAAREVPWEEAHAQIHVLGHAVEPWQREDGTLAHYSDLRGLVVGTGAAVFRLTSDDRALLLQLAGDEEAARDLLTSIRAHGVVTVFNVAADDPTMTAVRALGGKVTIRQREMLLRLA